MTAVLGLPLVIANLTRIGARIIEAESDARHEIAEKIRDAWADNIVSEGLVDTGRYHGSITVQGEGEEVGVVTDVDYARFLEYGTSRSAAHPVAERAFEEHGEEALRHAGDTVGGVIR